MQSSASVRKAATAVPGEKSADTADTDGGELLVVGPRLVVGGGTMWYDDLLPTSAFQESKRVRLFGLRTERYGIAKFFCTVRPMK